MPNKQLNITFKMPDQPPDNRKPFKVGKGVLDYFSLFMNINNQFKWKLYYNKHIL